MVGWSVTFDNEHQFDEEIEEAQAHLTQNTTCMLCKCALKSRFQYHGRRRQPNMRNVMFVVVFTGENITIYTAMLNQIFAFTGLIVRTRK